MYEMGCRSRNANERGAMILDFGSPRKKRLATAGGLLQYGTGLLNGTDESRNFRTTLDIEGAVANFIRGYMSSQTKIGMVCQPSSDRRSLKPFDLLTIIVTTTNSAFTDGAGTVRQNPALTRDHGEKWSDMIDYIYDTNVSNGYSQYISISAGFDAEVGDEWGAELNTLDWIDGYVDRQLSKLTPKIYYNIGSCDGCSRKADITTGSTLLERTYQYSRRKGVEISFPQIYHAEYAFEWYDVRRYGASMKNDNFTYPLQNHWMKRPFYAKHTRSVKSFQEQSLPVVD